MYDGYHFLFDGDFPSLAGQICQAMSSSASHPLDHTATVGNIVCCTPMLCTNVLNANQGVQVSHIPIIGYGPTRASDPTYRMQIDCSTTRPHIRFEC